MNNIIGELYLGNINPSECIPAHERYKKLAREVLDLQERFSESLGGEMENAFLALLDKDCEKQDLEVRIRFAEGFCLGAKIMLAVTACPEP